MNRHDTPADLNWKLKILHFQMYPSLHLSKISSIQNNFIINMHENIKTVFDEFLKNSTKLYISWTFLLNKFSGPSLQVQAE